MGELSAVNIISAARILFGLAKYQLENPDFLREAKLIPFLEGPPGGGKTSICRQLTARISEALNGGKVGFFHHTPADTDPVEFAGILMPDQVRQKVTRYQSDVIITDEDLEEQGMVAAVLLLDEIPNCSPAQMANLSRLTEERAFGHHKMSDRVIMITAGNRPKDRANANVMPTHLRDRLSFISIEPDADVTREYLLRKGCDRSLISYIGAMPDVVNRYSPTEQVNCTPRSLEKSGHIIRMWKDGLISEDDFQCFMAGTVGSRTATEFAAYMKVEGKLPDWKEIVKNPEGFKIPKETDGKDSYVMWALIGLMHYHASFETLPIIAKIITRLIDKEGRGEYAALAYREIEGKGKDFRPPWMAHPDIQRLRVKLFTEVYA